MSDVETRFATIVLAGRPNTGKSTLLNALVGQKLAITSAKPQSTRFPVVGVWTEGETQLAFIDPPGLLDPTYPLQKAMVARAVEALVTASGIVFLHPLDEGAPPAIETLLPEETELRAPTLVVRTKADLQPPDRRTELPPDVLVVSAITREGMDALLEWCCARARPAPFRHDPDSASSQPVRFFVSEFIREAAFERLEQELPYSVCVEIDEFREASDPLYIRAAIYVERESQKGMVIGSGGRTIKSIGSAAREATEELLGRRAYLDLRVKVLPKWRKSLHHLRRMGLPVPE